MNTTDGLQIQIDKLLVSISQASFDRAKELAYLETVMCVDLVRGYMDISGKFRGQEWTKEMRDWFRSEAPGGDEKAAKCLVEFVNRLKCAGATVDAVLAG